MGDHPLHGFTEATCYNNRQGFDGLLSFNQIVPVFKCEIGFNFSNLLTRYFREIYILETAHSTE